MYKNGTAPNIGQYPRMHLMPSGLVWVCGGQARVQSWDPATGKWTKVTLTSTTRQYGCSFLLPLHNIDSEKGKILLVGGSPQPDQNATSVVEMLDFDAGERNYASCTSNNFSNLSAKGDCSSHTA